MDFRRQLIWCPHRWFKFMGKWEMRDMRGHFIEHFFDCHNFNMHYVGLRKDKINIVLHIPKKVKEYLELPKE